MRELAGKPGYAVAGFMNPDGEKTHVIGKFAISKIRGDVVCAGKENVRISGALKARFTGG